MYTHELTRVLGRPRRWEKSRRQFRQMRKSFDKLKAEISKVIERFCKGNSAISWDWIADPDGGGRLAFVLWVKAKREAAIGQYDEKISSLVKWLRQSMGKFVKVTRRKEPQELTKRGTLLPMDSFRAFDLALIG